MKQLTAIVLILFVISTSEMIFVAGHTAEETGMEAGQDIFTQNQALNNVPSPNPTTIPAQAIYLKPDYVPDIKPYIINKDHDIWSAKYPGSYITPDNEWVKYYASLLYIDYDGRIRYKNRTVPLLVDAEANVLSWTDEPFVNNYISDNEQFHFPPDADMWVMPDYYLTHGMKDDCDGWMVTVTSLMLSGEMSIKEKGQFVRAVVPSKAVLGYMGGYRDGWAEYQVYGMTFLTTTSLVTTGIDGQEKISSTEFVEKNKKNSMPVFEFTDKYFGKYNIW